MDKYSGTIFASAVALGAAATILAFSEVGQGAGNDYPYQFGLLATVRISALYFLIAFVAGPLYQLTKADWLAKVISNRRYIGLSFAFVHSIHLGFIILWINANPGLAEAMTLIVGGIAYLLMYLQALTSNNYSLTLLGKYWRWLHNFSMYYLWFIMTVTFAGHNYLTARIFTGVFLVALLVRILALFKRRQNRASKLSEA